MLKTINVNFPETYYLTTSEKVRYHINNMWYEIAVKEDFPRMYNFPLFVKVDFIGATFTVADELPENSGDFNVLLRKDTTIFYCEASQLVRCALSDELIPVIATFTVEHEGKTYTVSHAHEQEDIFCPHCGEFLLDAENIVKTSDDSFFCSEKCAMSAGYIRCHDCGKLVPDDEIREIHGRDVCDDCLDSKYRKCDHCGEYVAINSDSYIEIGDHIFCDSECAIEAGYARCDSCEEWFYGEDLTYHERSDSYLCDDCLNDARGDEVSNVQNMINSYGYKPDYSFKSTSEDERGNTLFLGTEVEKEFNNAEDFCAAIPQLAEFSEENHELVYLKHDGSLDEYGVEIVSMPCSLSYFQQNSEKFKEVFEILENNDAESNDSCGMHVHLSRKGISVEHEIKLELFFQIFARNIQKIAGRGSVYYAKYTVDRDTENRDLFTADACDDSRYRALNWQNSKTLEIRCFSSPMTFDDYMKKVEFCHAVYQFTKNSSFELIEKSDFSDFCNFVTSLSGKYPNLSNHLN